MIPHNGMNSIKIIINDMLCLSIIFKNNTILYIKLIYFLNDSNSFKKFLLRINFDSADYED